MADEHHIFDNFADTVSKFTIGFNKGVVMTTVTSRSMSLIEQNLHYMRESLETVVTAFEEIRATSESATKNSEQISTMMDSIQEQNGVVNAGISERVGEMQKTAENAQEIDTLFKDFAEKSKNIRSITEQIQDVSDRTNILAINASIEAARAGEVGKGFRIIANEVRNLATQTGDFAQEIDSTITEFGNAIQTVTEKMENFLKLIENLKRDFEGIKNTFDSNNRSVTETGQNLAMISGAIKEQNEALTDGLASLESIFSTSRDSEAVVTALLKSHQALDTLLNKKS